MRPDVEYRGEYDFQERIMTEKKIRMATGEIPGQQGHTIVGGRPAGKRDPGVEIPRTLEILVKKASLDPVFLQKLVDERSGLADEHSLPLDTSERYMLDMIPEAQLRTMAAHARVPESQKSMLKTSSIGALVALIAQFTLSPIPARPEVETGIRPDKPNSVITLEEPSASSLDDTYESTRGIRPDLPPSPAPKVIEVLQADDGPMLDYEAQGSELAEAVENMAAETGYSISIRSFRDFSPEPIIKTTTQGRTLFSSLRKICSEAASDKALFEINIKDKSVVILFRRPGSQTDRTTPAFPTIQTKPSPSNDSITRGIRPDIPPTRFPKRNSDR